MKSVYVEFSEFQVAQRKRGGCKGTYIYAPLIIILNRFLKVAPRVEVIFNPSIMTSWLIFNKADQSESVL